MMDNETFDEVLNGFKEADSIVKRLKTMIAELEEENKKLKSDLAFERTMLDNVRAEYDSLQNVIKKLEEEVEVWKNANKILRMHDAKMEYENKKLKEENENLKAIIDHYKKFEEGKEKLEGMLMEEDTLQELRDLGKI